MTPTELRDLARTITLLASEPVSVSDLARLPQHALAIARAVLAMPEPRVIRTCGECPEFRCETGLSYCDCTEAPEAGGCMHVSLDAAPPPTCPLRLAGPLTLTVEDGNG